MPALIATLIKQSGNIPITYTTLDGTTDTLEVSLSSNQSLMLTNPTGGAITFTMIGADAPATTFCAGVGTVPVTAESVTVDPSDSVSVYLSSLRTKLAGEVTITGGTGLEALQITY